MTRSKRGFLKLLALLLVTALCVVALATSAGADDDEGYTEAFSSVLFASPLGSFISPLPMESFGGVEDAPTDLSVWRER